jgi:predicted kinase
MAHSTLISSANPLVILVTGLPASGKTTVAHQVARHLGLPVFGKDDFKEILFDTLGWKDRQWSRRLSQSCHRLLECVVETEVVAGRSLIVESNFPAHAAQQLNRLRELVPYHAVQLQCVAKGEVLLDRFQRRSHSRDRHPGHVDSVLENELRPSLLRGRPDPLNIPGPVLEVDTTHWETIDWFRLLHRLDTTLNDLSHSRP